MGRVLSHQNNDGKISRCGKYDQQFHYCSVMGKLNYLEESTRPYIAYVVHQCAQLSKDRIKPQGEAVKRIGRHLKETDKLTYIFAFVTSTSRYGPMLISTVIGFQRKLRMIQIRHIIDRYLLYHIWYVQLCGSNNFRKRYPSALLRVITLHSLIISQDHYYHRAPKT